MFHHAKAKIATTLAVAAQFASIAVSTASEKKDRIKNGKLFLRTAKTGTDVFCPLPQVVIEALDQIGSENGYYFWSGQSKPKSAVGNYQRALKTLFG